MSGQRRTSGQGLHCCMLRCLSNQLTTNGGRAHPYTIATTYYLTSKGDKPRLNPPLTRLTISTAYYVNVQINTGLREAFEVNHEGQSHTGLQKEAKVGLFVPTLHFAFAQGRAVTLQCSSQLSFFRTVCYEVACD
eukprot:1082904-Amphidinium_carterae.1